MKPKSGSNAAGGSHVKPFDLCYTPAYALDPLVPYLADRLPVGSVIWECAAGGGYLVQGLRDRGIRAFGTDLAWPEGAIGSVDFLASDSDRGFVFAAIVTNPPYSIKADFIARAYALGVPFAMLVPVETIGRKDVQGMMRDHGAELLLLNRRVNFIMPREQAGGPAGSGAQFPVLWFCSGLLPAPLCYGVIEYPKESNHGARG